MAEVAEVSKSRKSVTFADGEIIVDTDGKVSTGDGEFDGEKDSAASHSGKAVDEATEDFDALTLGKKKKKKSVKKDDAEEDAAPADDAEPKDEFAALKKKKKKSKPSTTDTDDFEAKLAEAGATEATGDSTELEGAGQDAQEGDPLAGTGVWAHDSNTKLNYASLLDRFFTLLHESQGDMGGGSLKSVKIPPPQCLREGNKKTIFANIADISKKVKRSDEHVRQFLFAELGTTGSVDGSNRLVIKGKFQQKQIENVLRRYIVEYVTCKTCRSPDTELSKGENRLSFVTCNKCGSRRSVTAINKGFSAQVGKRKRQQG